ncbi:hypothetical protein FACS1894191_1030 [Clostridia bacterium]|nr:hypothetical protein FACS1894191_1030 [Clostridia bacterium]
MVFSSFGAHCLQEREVYIKDTSAHNTWNAYGKLLGSPDFYRPVIIDDRILAYAVTITGADKGRIKGDIYELDYRDHIRQLDKQALPRITETATYADGTVLTLPCAELNAKWERLYHQHGQVQTLISHPEDEGALRDILKAARDKRESEATPAAFKVRVQNPKPKKQTIKQQIAENKKQLDAQRAAAPQRAAAKSKNELEV